MIIHRLRGLFHQAIQTWFDHVHCKANLVTDILAKSSLKCMEDGVFDSVLGSISLALLVDSSSIAFPMGFYFFFSFSRVF